jgi:hypothetical protein
MKKKIEIEVSKEMHDVGVLVADLVKGLLAKKSITELAIAELQALKDAVDGITLVPGEVSEDPGAFALAIAVPMASILSAVTKKPEAAPVAAPEAPAAV